MRTYRAIFSIGVQTGTIRINDPIHLKLLDSLSDCQLVLYAALESYLAADFQRIYEFLARFQTLYKNRNTEDDDQAFTVNYFNFLSQLIQGEGLGNDVARPAVPLYHVGDSHCLSFAHRRLRFVNDEYVVKPLITFGTKAYHLSVPRDNQYKAITKYNLKRVSKNSRIMFSFGEIDCRYQEGILLHNRKTERPIDAIVRETVSGYCSWVERNTPGGCQKIFVAVPPPIERTLYSKKQNAQVASVVREFNAQLQHLSGGLADAHFLDTYHTMAKSDGHAFPNLHCDETHLSSSAWTVVSRSLLEYFNNFEQQQ